MSDEEDEGMGVGGIVVIIICVGLVVWMIKGCSNMDQEWQAKENAIAVRQQAERAHQTALAEHKQAVLAKHADINARSPDEEMTALMIAVSNKELEYVEILLKRGADVNAQNAKGETALMLAIDNNCEPPLIELLLKNGANQGLYDKQEKNALDRAVTQSLPKIIALLDRHPAPPPVAEKEK